MSWEKRRRKLQKNPAGRLLLGALSLAYGAVVITRRWLYELRVLPSRKLPAKVVCIGNLTTGGTGKTPAVLLAAQTLRKRNFNVAILTRGYGRNAKNGDVMTLLEDAPPPWTECGDEPWMMQHSLHGQNVPVLICADRAKAGHEAITYYHSRILILDDGFQHLKLQRDLDIVLVNASDPFGGGRLLPLGNLREPVRTLSRAHMVVLTHVDRVTPETLEDIKGQIHAVNPGIPILESIHKADFLLDVKSEKKHRLSHLMGHKVVAFSGIADPGSFEDLLVNGGAHLAQKWRYPDHHPFRLRELRSIEQLRHGMPVVTTFKDFVRLPPGWREILEEEVYVLAIRLEILKGKNIWIDTLLDLASAA